MRLVAGLMLMACILTQWYGVIPECDSTPFYKGGVHLAPPLLSDDDMGYGGVLPDDAPFAAKVRCFLQIELQTLDKSGKISAARGTEGMRAAFLDSQRLQEPHAYSQDYLMSPTTPKPFFNLVECLGENVYCVPLLVPPARAGDAPDQRYSLLFSNVRAAGAPFPMIICPDEEADRYREALAAVAPARALAGMATPAPELFAFVLEDAWMEGGVMSELMPYDTDAQACYARIRGLAAGIPIYDDRLSAETWYKICAARLFGSGDYRSVLGFFAAAKRAAEDDDTFYVSVLRHGELLSLYLVARMMDGEDIAASDDVGQDLRAYYLAQLFGGRIGAWAIEYGDGFFDAIGDAAQAHFEAAIGWYRQAGDFDRAINMADALIGYLRHSARNDPSYAGSLADGLDAALDWRGQLTREGQALAEAGVDPFLPGRIEAAWSEAGLWVESPFSPEAQACCGRILSLADGVWGFTTGLDAETWRRLCYARLYGKADYQYVLAFVRFVVSVRQTDERFFEAVAGSQEILTMYLIARIMDQDATSRETGSERSFFEQDIESLYGQQAAWVADRYGERFRQTGIEQAVKLTMRMILALKKKGDADRAIGVASSFIEYLGHERDLPGASPLHDRFVRDVATALDMRNTIMRLRSQQPESETVAGLSRAAALQWAGSRVDHSVLTGAFRDAGLQLPDGLSDRGVLVFSEKVTFHNGLGYFLPRLADAGIRVAVVAVTPEERAVIDRLNHGKEESRKIIIGASTADIAAQAKSPKYYYFKIAGEPEPAWLSVDGSTYILTSDIIKKIIDALGAVAGITERSRLDELHEAAQEFSLSA